MAQRKAGLILDVDFSRDLLCSCNKCQPIYRLRDGRLFMAQLDAHEREHGEVFAPKFDASGLLTAVVTDSVSKDVLMVAFMDAEALAKTRETGLAHFHSRSRGRLWLKGETSGHFLRVQEIRVDCDQDALVVVARPEGPACHTGAVSCFYRRLKGDSLALIG
jgi:phosphoribosyl-AMP cyclohydrolase